MDLELSDDQRAVRDMAREFARTEIAPCAGQRDRDSEFPAAVMARAGELGLCGMSVPEEWGGSDLDPISYCLVLEEVARECASTAVTLSVTNSVCAQPIARFGTDEQKSRYLRDLATGKTLGGFMLTEPGSGSDARAMRTRAVRDGDDFVLDGSKAWVTNAGVAAVFVVFARTGEAPGDLTAFLVEAGTPGLEIERMEDKMGLRASKTAAYSLTGVRVPQANVLGTIGQGMKVAFGSLDRGRLGIASQALGMGEAALAESAGHARERVTFGKTLGEHQAIQWMLADMRTRLDAGRMLLMRAAGQSERGTLQPAAASMAKLACTETAQWSCDRAVQIFGGSGYSREFKVERLHRDVRVTTIYEGTTQMQQIVIARSLLAR